ncbi:hypothetical protein [Synechococcus sp. CBW1107]|jgi:diphthamide synthase subunit DPH2|uniref:hypothetical protein n=1 Tax=Synechococcus sp. CBW1107 TaxID=2789857 RepID=UPI002AD2F191|nr:hypothetical protein [Synechococcus sp. CBW1107]
MEIISSLSDFQSEMVLGGCSSSLIDEFSFFYDLVITIGDASIAESTQSSTSEVVIQQDS